MSSDFVSPKYGPLTLVEYTDERDGYDYCTVRSNQSGQVFTLKSMNISDAPNMGVTKLASDVHPSYPFDTSQPESKENPITAFQSYTYHGDGLINGYLREGQQRIRLKIGRISVLKLPRETLYRYYHFFENNDRFASPLSEYCMGRMYGCVMKLDLVQLHTLRYLFFQISLADMRETYREDFIWHRERFSDDQILAYINQMDHYFQHTSFRTPTDMYLFRGLKDLNFAAPSFTDWGYMSTTLDLTVASSFTGAELPTTLTKHGRERLWTMNDDTDVLPDFTPGNPTDRFQCCLVIIKVPQGTPYAILHNVTKFQNEREVLLPRGLTVNLRGTVATRVDRLGGIYRLVFAEIAS